MEDKSNFVEYHVPCDKCGSSDARSINEDGSSYCFACENYFPPDNEDIQLIKEKGDNMELVKELPNNILSSYSTNISGGFLQ